MLVMERHGKPAVAIVSDEFAANARMSSVAFGIPGNRFAVVPDSPEGIAPEKIIEEIDAVVDDIIEYLTTVPPPSGGSNGAAAAVAERLEEPPVGEHTGAAQVEAYTGLDQLDAVENFNRVFIDKGRGDGFPMAPPTAKRVEEMLSGTTRGRDEVIAILQPGMGLATVEKIAINCVMGGCEPNHLPVVMAAVKAVENMGFYARSWLMSTSASAPMVFISGPIVEELGIHTGQCTLGPSKWSKANIVIGRALNLTLMNVGYHRPREMDLDTIGTPLKWSMCTGENEERSPWQSFHVDHGFEAHENVVTVIPVGNQIEIAEFVSSDPRVLLNEFIYGTISHGGPIGVSNMGSPPGDRSHTVTDPSGKRKSLPGGLFILMAPEHAELLARFGWGKESAQNYLWINQKYPAKWAANMAKWWPAQTVREEWKWLLEASDYELDNTMLQCRQSPSNYHIVVVGGWGAKSIVLTTSGAISMMEVTDRA